MYLHASHLCKNFALEFASMIVNCFRSWNSFACDWLFLREADGLYTYLASSNIRRLLSVNTRVPQNSHPLDGLFSAWTNPHDRYVYTYGGTFLKDEFTIFNIPMRNKSFGPGCLQTRCIFAFAFAFLSGQKYCGYLAFTISVYLMFTGARERARIEWFSATARRVV